MEQNERWHYKYITVFLFIVFMVYNNSWSFSRIICDFYYHHSWQQCLSFISDLNYFSHHSMFITIIYYFWFSCSSYWTVGHQFVSHSVCESWKLSCIFCLASLWKHVLLGTGCRFSFCYVLSDAFRCFQVDFEVLVFAVVVLSMKSIE